RHRQHHAWLRAAHGYRAAQRMAGVELRVTRLESYIRAFGCGWFFDAPRGIQRAELYGVAGVNGQDRRQITRPVTVQRGAFRLNLMVCHQGLLERHNKIYRAESRPAS